jgi:NAD(P)-dependent dehydrogenase (short-subunit alcohol dehydrogenase family)
MSASEKRCGQLAGRIAVISGGAQGIGRAIAECFQREAASVVLLDCEANTVAAAARELTGRRPSLPVSSVRADLGNPGEIQEAIERFKVLSGRIDILVNNAGIELAKPFAEVLACEWDRVVNVNLRGAFLLTQAVLPLFPDTGGAIINISSVHATHAFPDSIPYACSKAALIALTRNLALELAPRCIRVNSICPGYIDTRLWEGYLRHSPDPAALAAQTAALHPIGRRGVPADIGEAALFLVSEGASFITGSNLVVDGGLTIRANA